MESYQEYIVDSNEAMEFKFVCSAEDIESDDIFKPDMSHQVFGDMETIFGYEDLTVQLYYTPGWLHTYFGMKYKSKVEPKELIVELDDVTNIITKFLEHDVYQNIDLFVNKLKDEPTFKPFGEMVYAFTIQDENESEKKYETYHISGACHNNKFFEYYKRLQNFVIWYIDCASFIDLDDDKWQYFIMYEKYKHREQGMEAYAVVGFATVYEYWAFPYNIRPRISQMLIFPSFREKGLAAYLLNSIYQHYIPNKLVLDITVEGANPSFQKVRDFVDVCRCESLKCFSPDKLKNGFTKDMAKELQRQFKIHEKQARRIYEILLLRIINRFDEDEQRNYRIKIKRRINAQFERANMLLRKIYNTSDDARVAQAALSTGTSRIDMLNKEYKYIEEQYYGVIDRFLSKPFCP